MSGWTTLKHACLVGFILHIQLTRKLVSVIYCADFCSGGVQQCERNPLNLSLIIQVRKSSKFLRRLSKAKRRFTSLLSVYVDTGVFHSISRWLNESSALVVAVDRNLTFQHHIANLCKSVFYHIKSEWH